EVGRVEHDGEQVVEVVRDASREAAEALEALDVREPELELRLVTLAAALLGDVARDRRYPGHGAGVVDDRSDEHPDVADGAVLADPLPIERLDSLARRRPPHHL